MTYSDPRLGTENKFLKTFMCVKTCLNNEFRNLVNFN